MTHLPTPAQMLDNADGHLKRSLSALSDARDELKSDWPPGYVMTDAQAERRTRMVKAIGEAKAAIEEGRR